MKSYISGIILLLSAVIVEMAILSNITILPSVPDLLLIALLYVSLKNGRTQGQVLGFFSGLFLDLMSGIPLGFNCIVRTIIGYVAGVLGTTINSDSFFMVAVFGFLGTIIKVFISWIVSVLFPAVLNSYDLFSASFIFEIIVNTVLAPFLFKFFSLFNFLLIDGSGERI